MPETHQFYTVPKPGEKASFSEFYGLILFQIALLNAQQTLEKKNALPGKTN